MPRSYLPSTQRAIQNTINPHSKTISFKSHREASCLFKGKTFLVPDANLPITTPSPVISSSRGPMDIIMADWQIRKNEKKPESLEDYKARILAKWRAKRCVQ